MKNVIKYFLMVNMLSVSIYIIVMDDVGFFEGVNFEEVIGEVFYYVICQGCYMLMVQGVKGVGVYFVLV